MLNEAISPDVVEGIRQLYMREPTFELVQLNCALAALRLEEARVQRDQQLFDKVQHHVEQARAASRAEMLPDMVQGMLELAKVSTSQQWHPSMKQHHTRGTLRQREVCVYDRTLRLGEVHIKLGQHTGHSSSVVCYHGVTCVCGEDVRVLGM